MSAIAGPGPSSSRFSNRSSMNPSPEKDSIEFRPKSGKRTINLVNPADTEEFSTSTMSPNTSGDSIGGRRSREVTPTLDNFIVRAATPMSSENSKKGILRPAGAPGSGNGVRFFPKNRFRVITPNASPGAPTTPQKQPPALSSSTQSKTSTTFFSSLLAVVPVISPRRAIPADESIDPESSWEQPGEEGEISMMGSSFNNSRQDVDREDDEEDDEYVDQSIGEVGEEGGNQGEGSWNGVPEVYCSPISTPMELSKEISTTEIFSPARSLIIQNKSKMVDDSLSDWMKGRERSDISDLLHASLPEQSGFSMMTNSTAGPSFIRPTTPSTPHQTQRQQQSDMEAGEEDVSGVSWMRPDADESSTQHTLDEDDNPTIRRRLSPTSSPQAPNIIERPHSVGARDESTSLAVEKGLKKTFTSIFADLSAEHANMEWPLPKAVTAENSIDEFHSITNQSTANVGPDPSPLRTAVAETVKRPTILPTSTPTTNQSTPGGLTIWYDTTASLPPPCPSKPSSLAAPLTSIKTSTYHASLPRNINFNSLISNQTKTFFKAQEEHEVKISEELSMYKALVSKLGREVEERDRCLGDMKVRLVELELEKQNQMRVDNEGRSGMREGSSSRESSMTPSPLALKSKLAATAAASKNSLSKADTVDYGGEVARDLEIRLQKALTDLKDAQAELRLNQEGRTTLNDERDDLKVEMERMREDERERMIIALSERKELEDVRAQLVQAQDKIKKDSNKMITLETSLVDRRSFEVEIVRLNEERRQSESENKKEVEQLNKRVEETENEYKRIQRDIEVIEKELLNERRSNQDLEGMIEELKIALHDEQSTSSKKSLSSMVDIDKMLAEIKGLKSSLSNKDLEISALQKRKMELKEDREMLNIALDSKQQEVELLKRKMSRMQITPLSASSKNNMKTSISATPLPSSTSEKHNLKLNPNTTVKRSSSSTTNTNTASQQNSGRMGTDENGRGSLRSNNMTFATPLQMNGKSKDGKVLYGSTLLRERTLRSSALPEKEVPNDESRKMHEEYQGSLSRQSSKRERVLA